MIIKICLNNISKFVKIFRFLLSYYLMPYLNRFILMLIYELLLYYQKLRKTKINIKCSMLHHI